MSQTPRVLICDDEPSSRKSLEMLLHREGYDLSFAENGPMALEMMDKVLPSTILLDVMMPGMDGIELCRRLKAEERWRHIPIVLITALDSKEDLARGLAAGAEDFLSKPVSGIELRARVRSMLRIKAQYDQLMAIMTLREDLANMIVHDMRNPLAIISGIVYLLIQKGSLDSEDEKTVRHIQLQADGLNGLLTDMLLLAKVEDGKFVANRQKQDLGELTMEVKENYKLLAESRDVRLVFDLPEQRPEVSIDAALFRRLLDNLLSNALKFSSAGMTVTVRFEFAPTGRLYVRVLDEGPGIPEEARERIFRKFETISANRKGIAQVGLGLTFCKLVAQAHDGRIYVEPNQPRGSIFTVEI